MYFADLVSSSVNSFLVSTFTSSACTTSTVFSAVTAASATTVSSPSNKALNASDFPFIVFELTPVFSEKAFFSNVHWMFSF